MQGWECECKYKEKVDELIRSLKREIKYSKDINFESDCFMISTFVDKSYPEPSKNIEKIINLSLNDFYQKYVPHEVRKNVSREYKNVVKIMKHSLYLHYKEGMNNIFQEFLDYFKDEYKYKLSKIGELYLRECILKFLEE